MKWYQRQWWYVERPFPWLEVTLIIIGFACLASPFVLWWWLS